MAPQPRIPTAPAIAVCFRSGMSRRSDLRGALDAGLPIGVVATEMSTAAQLMSLPRYLDNGGYVFVDSGAFTEFRTGLPVDWPRVYRAYESLIEMTDRAQRLYIVAPDKVGDQAESLCRLAAEASRVQRWIAAGAQVIVPLQRGSLAVDVLLETVKDILGTDRFVVGIPSNEAALTIEDCAQLQHHAFHILGRVQEDQTQQARVSALACASPTAILTADASWLRSRLKAVNKLAREVRAEDRAQARDPLAAWATSPRARAVAKLAKADYWGADCVTQNKHFAY